MELLGSGDVGGIHHVVNAAFTSRAGWARELFRQAGVDVEVEDVPASTWAAPRPRPPGPSSNRRRCRGGEPLRSWQAALADYMPRSCAPRRGRSRSDVSRRR